MRDCSPAARSFATSQPASSSASSRCRSPWRSRSLRVRSPSRDSTRRSSPVCWSRFSAGRASRSPVPPAPSRSCSSASPHGTGWPDYRSSRCSPAGCCCFSAWRSSAESSASSRSRSCSASPRASPSSSSWVSGGTSSGFLPSPGATLLEKLPALVASFAHIQPATTALGVASLLIVALWPRIPVASKVPSPMVALVAATVFVTFAHPAGVATIGTAFGGIPRGLPPLTLPARVACHRPRAAAAGDRGRAARRHRVAALGDGRRRHARHQARPQPGARRAGHRQPGRGAARRVRGHRRDRAHRDQHPPRRQQPGRRHRPRGDDPAGAGAARPARLQRPAHHARRDPVRGGVQHEPDRPRRARRPPFPEVRRRRHARHARALRVRRHLDRR